MLLVFSAGCNQHELIAGPNCEVSSSFCFAHYEIRIWTVKSEGKGGWQNTFTISSSTVSALYNQFNAPAKWTFRKCQFCHQGCYSPAEKCAASEIAS